MPSETEILNDFQAFLHPKAEGKIRGRAKLVIEGVGAVLLDETGARVADEEADVVLKAKEEVFRRILSGEQNAIMAVMTRKLHVEGSPERALKVAGLLVG